MAPIDQAHETIKRNDVDKLKALIQSHPYLLNQRSEDNDRTLLHAISDYPGHRPRGVEMARLLIDAGADVNVRFQHERIESVKETPLHWTASNDDLELAELLLDECAEIDIDRGAALNLMIVVGAGRRDLVDQFLDDEGSVIENAGTLPCWDEPRPPKTALDSAFGFACRNGHVTLGKNLLEGGADPNWVNPAGQTALQQAKSGNHKIVVDWLKERGIVSLMLESTA